MVKAIIFDCFGVLTTDTWKEFVAILPESQRSEAREFAQAYGAAYLGKAEFIEAIQDLTGKSPINVDSLVDHVSTKNAELFEYIAMLKKSYKIGLLSNVGSNWIREHFLTPDEQALFDSFVFSYEVHMVKPDPRIFKLAAERLSVELESCVLVDDAERYCAAARELGMGAVFYQNFPQTKTDLEKLLS